MEGRWISPEDIAERRRVAFLGAILRRKLFSGTPAIGETVRIDGVKFTVVGSMDTKFSDSNYSRATTSLCLFRTPRQASCGTRATPA